jgi:hypothetical protein
MAALDLALDKLVVTQDGKLQKATQLDIRVMMERALAGLGFSSFVVSNTAPADKTVLWWHKDVKTPKRYNAVLGNWYALTPGQHAMHLLQQLFGASVADTVLEAGDLFSFYDVSLGETKKIARDDLIKAIAGKALWNWSRISSNTNAVDRGAYFCDTTAATFTLTLPASPPNYTAVWIADNGDFELKNLIIARNGSTIEGLSQDLNAEIYKASFQLVAYSGNWIIV